MRFGNKDCERLCGKRERIYVAISTDINSPSFSKGKLWEGLYVFKVGSTQACYDREASLNRDIPKQRPYAGVKDWRVIRCWSAEMKRQDEKRFRPWAKTHIRYLDPSPDPYGIAREDLYCLTEGQVASGRWGATSDRLNDEIVEVAIHTFRKRLQLGTTVDLTRSLTTSD
jgi:hypothetical protein